MMSGPTTWSCSGSCKLWAPAPAGRECCTGGGYFSAILWPGGRCLRFGKQDLRVSVAPTSDHSGSKVVCLLRHQAFWGRPHEASKPKADTIMAEASFYIYHARQGWPPSNHATTPKSLGFSSSALNCRFQTLGTSGLPRTWSPLLPSFNTCSSKASISQSSRHWHIHIKQLSFSLFFVGSEEFMPLNIRVCGRATKTIQMLSIWLSFLRLSTLRGP